MVVQTKTDHRQFLDLNMSSASRCHLSRWGNAEKDGEIETDTDRLTYRETDLRTFKITPDVFNCTSKTSGKTLLKKKKKKIYR